MGLVVWKLFNQEQTRSWGSRSCFVSTFKPPCTIVRPFVRIRLPELQDDKADTWAFNRYIGTLKRWSCDTMKMFWVIEVKLHTFLTAVTLGSCQFHARTALRSEKLPQYQNSHCVGIGCDTSQWSLNTDVSGYIPPSWGWNFFLKVEVVCFSETSISAISVVIICQSSDRR